MYKNWYHINTLNKAPLWGQNIGRPKLHIFIPHNLHSC